MMEFKRDDCEYLRSQARSKFDNCRADWIEALNWAYPSRAKWILSQTPGQRNNRHIVDGTQTLALRSCVAGFSEGNTSPSRPWARHTLADEDLAKYGQNKEWIQKFTRATLANLSVSNFYHHAPQFYYDFNVVNSGCHIIDEIMVDGRKRMHFHTLAPGSYYLLNNGLGEAVVLVHEFTLTVRALVETYGKKVGGSWDWSNFSNNVRRLFENGDYSTQIDCVMLIQENRFFNYNLPQALLNKKWIRLTYEVGGSRNGSSFGSNLGGDAPIEDVRAENKFLEVKATKRKPFIAGRSYSTANFEYGEHGPTTDCLGIIKSLNKKGVSKDQAIEQMLRPAIQGPASLRKSYVTTTSNAFVPMDPNSMKQGGLKTIYEVNPAITALLEDVSDLRQMIDRFYYADFLLYLTKNPKTRTATEVDNIVREQQLVLGPALQSLNPTYNNPVFDYASDFTLDNDPDVAEVPPDLQGQSLRTDFISVFAQAQRAADLPNIKEYVNMIMNIAPIAPQILQKANLDKLADLYEDRLYLPAGLNNPQSKVDAQREQAAAQAQRTQQLTEIVPAIAGAAKDVGLNLNGQQA